MWSCWIPNMEVLTVQTFFFVLPPTTSNTHQPTASICSDGLDAWMTLLMQPQVHLHCPQLLQIQSLTPNFMSLSSSVMDAVIATLPPPPPQPCTTELEVHCSTHIWPNLFIGHNAHHWINIGWLVSLELITDLYRFMNSHDLATMMGTPYLPLLLLTQPQPSHLCNHCQCT